MKFAMVLVGLTAAQDMNVQQKLSEDIEELPCEAYSGSPAFP